MIEAVLTDGEFDLLRRLIHAHAGIALGPWKRYLVRARLTRRLQELGLSTFAEYHTRLLADASGGELTRFINAMTTNKTEFFREGHHFDILRAQVAATAARAGYEGPRTLRMWSAGCSSGEEPYSMAITVLDTLGRARSWDVRILASDIDTDILATAAAGVYAEERVEAVPVELRQRYFVRGRGAQSGFVRVRGEARELVTFRRINLRDDVWPIRTPLDAIFCRNVLIYFDGPSKKRVIDRLLDRLEPGGCLFLGHAESLSSCERVRSVGPTVYGLKDRA